MVTETAIHNVRGIRLLPTKQFSESAPEFYNRNIEITHENGATFILNLFADKREDLKID